MGIEETDKSCWQYRVEEQDKVRLNLGPVILEIEVVSLNTPGPIASIIQTKSATLHISLSDPPGLAINIRVEDIGGRFLFAAEGEVETSVTRHRCPRHHG